MSKKFKISREKNNNFLGNIVSYQNILDSI